MATAVEFKGQTRILGAPAGQEDRVSGLPVFQNGHTVTSKWKLSPEEIASGYIFVTLWSGPTMHPILVTDEDTTREFIAEMGVWPK